MSCEVDILQCKCFTPVLALLVFIDMSCISCKTSFICLCAEAVLDGHTC